MPTCGSRAARDRNASRWWCCRPSAMRSTWAVTADAAARRTTMTETNNTDETLARITELARQALQSQSTLAKQSLELGRAALSGDVDRSTAGKAYLDAVSREGARYWREAGALGLDYASELMALGTRSAARIISDASTAGGTRVRRGATDARSGAPRAPAPEPDDGLRHTRVLLRA